MKLNDKDSWFYSSWLVRIVSAIFSIILLASGMQVYAAILAIGMGIGMETLKYKFFYETFTNVKIHLLMRGLMMILSLVLVYVSIIAASSFLNNQDNIIANNQYKNSDAYNQATNQNKVSQSLLDSYMAQLSILQSDYAVATDRNKLVIGRKMADVQENINQVNKSFVNLSDLDMKEKQVNGFSILKTEESQAKFYQFLIVVFELLCVVSTYVYLHKSNESPKQAKVEEDNKPSNKQKPKQNVVDFKSKIKQEDLEKFAKHKQSNPRDGYKKIASKLGFTENYAYEIYKHFKSKNKVVI